MPDPIEFHSVDALGAGAVGEPGRRAFYLQARSEAAQLTVLVEKGVCPMDLEESLRAMARFRNRLVHV